MRLASLLGSRRRLLLFVGVALVLAATIAVASVLLTSDVPSDSSPGCLSCGGGTRTPLPEGEFVLDEQRQKALAESRQIVYQGLLVGEAPNGLAPFSQEATGEWALLYSYALPTEDFQPESNFTLRLLADWQESITELRLYLVLTGLIESSIQDRINAVLGNRISTIADPDGTLRQQLRLEDSPPGFGFLLNPDGVVAVRIPPLRLENASYIRQLLEDAVSRTNPAQPSLTRFPAIHPAQVESPLQEICAEATFTHGNPARLAGLPTLVYAFAPDCEPCNLATEVTLQLASEYTGQINVLGFAFALSSESMRSSQEHAEQYRSALQAERMAWARTLPQSDSAMVAYVDAIPGVIGAYVGDAPIGWSAAIDWDRQLSGAMGMGIAPLPCWAFVSRDGTLLDVVPGRLEIVNLEGEFVESTLPSIAALREMIEHLLLSDTSD